MVLLAILVTAISLGVRWDGPLVSRTLIQLTILAVLTTEE